jgi:hypothetical protein
MKALSQESLSPYRFKTGTLELLAGVQPTWWHNSVIVLLQKLMANELVKKVLAFLWNFEVHYKINMNLSLDPPMKQMSILSSLTQNF